MLHAPTSSATPGGASSSQGTRGRLRSETYVPQTMPKAFTSIDLAAIYLITILFITNVPNAIAGGAATFTYWLLGFLGFFLPSILMTAQLAVMLPYEGGLYHWTHQALGRYWSFFATFCAWFPAILLIVSTPALLVGVVQGLHPTWLVDPWQQGLVIAGLVIVSGVIALQRQRTVAIFLTMTAAFLVVGLLLIGLCGAFWLLVGHPSATSFTHLSDWSINWDTKTGNLGVFGVVGLACLGADIPARLLGEARADGEASRRRLITRHLLWGSLLVVGGYLVTTWSLLVVQGAQANFTLFSLISTVDMALGKAAGDIVALCLLLWLVAATVAYNATYARLLLVGGVDQRLPTRVARLNRNRAPASAIVFQTIVAVIVTLLTYCLLPYVIQLGVKPADLATGILNVMLAGLSLMWVASTLFLFVDATVLLLRNPIPLRGNNPVVSPLVLLLAVMLGTVFGLLAIVDTLVYSWIPTIVDNSRWWYLVGGLTLICLISAAIGSMVASSEAAWESISKAHLPQGGAMR